MELYELVDLGPCPKCGGTGYLENEGKNGVYVTCIDCGAQTVALFGDTEEKMILAARKVEHLWNSGKAVDSEPGE